MKLCFPELSEVAACGGSEMQPAPRLREIVRCAHSEMQTAPRLRENVRCAPGEMQPAPRLREIVRCAHSENIRKNLFQGDRAKRSCDCRRKRQRKESPGFTERG